MIVIKKTTYLKTLKYLFLQKNHFLNALFLKISLEIL